MYIFLNGNIVSKEKAVISPFDHGYMYGLGLFETFRVYDGHPFLLDDHLARLEQGLVELNIEWSMEKKDILTALSQLLAANSLTDGYVRLNVSAGNGEIGLQVDTYEKPTTIMYMKPLPSNQEFGEKEGIILKTRRNTPEGAIRLKSHHYLNNIFGKREIGNNPSKEGIFLNEDGYVAEGVVSNLFWVKKDTLFTPHVDTGILDGITRKFVIALAKSLRIQVVEGFFTLNDINGSEEAFVTNSIQEIVPLKSLNGKTLPGRLGRVSRELMRSYKEYRNILWTSRYFLDKDEI